MIRPFYRALLKQLDATERKKDLGYAHGFYDGLLWARETLEEYAFEAGFELDGEEEI